MSQRLLKFSTIFLILIYAFAPQTLGITVSSSTQAAGKITSLSESLDLDGSTLLHESQSLGSGRILLDRQAEGYGDNRLKQSLSGTGYAVQNNIDSQGEFKASTSTLASAEGASVNQYVGGVGSLSLDLQGREEATDASQGADVAGGSLVSSQSLSTGQGVSASQRTEIEGLEGNILAGAMGTEKVMIARGSFEGRGSITADLDANTLNQGSTKGTVYLDDVALLNDDSFEAVSSDDEIQGMGLAGLRMVEGDLGSFDVSVINYDLDDLNRESYASKNDGASTSGGSASSYALTDFRWAKKDPEIQMYLNPTNIPSGIKDEAARDAIIAAANTWDDAVAQDIFADESTVVIDYSKEVPNFFGGNMRSDGFNVHGFKNFGNSYLAMTSYWTNGKIVDGKRPILESDIIYNLDYKWTEDLKQAEKTDKLDLQSVAVHELGHTIGLDDLYALSNGDARKKDFDQVMNLYNGPQRELGNGDKAGAQELYGVPSNLVSKAKYGWKGSTLPESTKWVQYDENSIYVDVDTSAAGFTETPLYFASLGGNYDQWHLDGVNAIYSPTSTGFRIYLRDDLGNPLTSNSANERGWYIQWTGIPKTESIAGLTAPRATEWKQYESNSIYVDVDTTKAGFTDTPLYFTSIGGDYSHWQADGTNAIYSPTNTGFRVYLRDDLSDYLTPELANQRSWNVQWIGVQKTDNQAGSTAYKATDWKSLNSNSVYVDVETDTGLTDIPMYFTSIAGDYRHWEVDGIKAIYSPTPEDFRIYLRDDLNDYLNPKLANYMGWNLQWAAN